MSTRHCEIVSSYFKMYQLGTFQIILSFILTSSIASIIPSTPYKSLSTRECRKISPSWISQISSSAPNTSYSNAISSNGAGSFFVYQNSSISPYFSNTTLNFPIVWLLKLSPATALLQYMSFTIPSSTQSPSSTNPTCTLAATFPFFESQYLGWSLSSPTPPTLDISIVSPLSNSPFNTPPTWTSAFFPENSDTPQHFGVLTPVLRLDTTVNSLLCPENGVLSFVFRFADGVVGNKTVYEIWPQYPAGLSSGLPMTGVYLSVCWFTWMMVTIDLITPEWGKPIAAEVTWALILR